MAPSLASDSMHPAGNLPPTLTPTGHFAGKPSLPACCPPATRLAMCRPRASRALASRAGTFVTGKQVHQVELTPGDEIKVGDTTMLYAAKGAGAAAAEQRRPTVPADLAVGIEDLAV